MVSPTSHITTFPLESLLQECLEAFRTVGGIRRCSIILLAEDLTHGFLKAGFDSKDPQYPPANLKVQIAESELLERCVAQRQPCLLKGPFSDGLPLLWDKIPDREKVSAIGLIPIIKAQQCFVVAGVMSEDPVDNLLEVRFRSWQVIGALFSSIISYSSADTLLLKEKAELENILHGIAHGIVVVDNNLKILRANSFIAEMVGRSPPELIGIPYEKLCHETGISQESSPLKESIATGKVTHAIKSCHTKQSEPELYLKVSCFPQRNSLGQVTHAIVYIRDVTSIVRAEILQKDLSHMIVHDIRNPILAAIQNLDLSVTGGHGWIPRHHREVLAATRDSCNLLLCMLDDMLDVYCHEAGEIHLNLQPANIQEIVHKAFKAIEALACEKAIHMRYDFSKDLPAFSGDEIRLIRVLINLLENAVKFSEKGCTIIVEAFINPEGGLELRVIDSGRGIPPEHLERIFWKFYQVDKDMGEKRAGVGLGLAYCRQTI